MRSGGLILFFVVVLAACATPVKDRARLKEELKREILAELAREAPPQGTAEIAGQPRVSAERGDLTQKGKEGLRETQPVTSGPAVKLPVAVGGVFGRVVKGKVGVADCRIRIVRWTEEEDPTEAYQALQTGVEFEAVTGADGKYAFAQIPVGAYRVKWQPRGESGWIRRLSDKPDVWVEEGKTVALRDILADRRLVPR